MRKVLTSLRQLVGISGVMLLFRLTWLFAGLTIDISMVATLFELSCKFCLLSSHHPKDSLYFCSLLISIEKLENHRKSFWRVAATRPNSSTPHSTRTQTPKKEQALYTQGKHGHYHRCILLRQRKYLKHRQSRF